MEKKIPVTVITGFLGSGKTTLINYILTAEHGKKIAIIENEFGEVGIDDGLVIKSKEEIFEMNNGCVCCTVRGDLVRTLNKIMKRKDKFDAIVIETTGLADPAPVIQTFFVDENLKSQISLDAVLTVVDCKHIAQHLDEEKPEGVVNEAAQQIAYADKILLSKVDLVSETEKRDVIERIKGINKPSEVLESRHGKVDVSLLLGIKAFNFERMLELDPEFKENVKQSEPGHEHENEVHDSHCDKKDSADLSHDHDRDHDRDGEHDRAHLHKHDDQVTSVGIIAEGECDSDLLHEWLGTLVREKGADLYRSKGIVCFSDSPHKHVFQGVHMLLQFSSTAEGVGRPWAEGEARVNKLVFIGKKLDREGLNQGFKACIIPKRREEPESKRQKTDGRDGI